jgi:hypothetical protein
MDAREQLTASLAMLGLPPIIPEPEVTKAALARIQCKSLATIVTALINDSEPMLKAEQDGETVTVRVRDGSATMRFTVEAK